MRRLLLVSVCLAGCGGLAPGELDEANTQFCPTPTVEGVDVYAGDGAIDWAKLKASGRVFAFIKATQGNYNKQSTFAAHWSGAAANGLYRSAYHFFDATIDGNAQAQWFLDEVNAAGGMRATDLPAMLDIECPTSSVQAMAQANCEYAGNSGWAPPATLAQRAFDWLAAVEKATGKKPIVYSYPAWFADAGFTDARLAAYPLFIATYGACASVPPPWTSAVFWQYSATGTVPGITPAADEDRFFGTLQQLGGFAAPPPADAGAADLATASAFDLGGDAGTMAKHRGCSCQLGAAPSPPPLAVAALLALVVVLRHARRRQLRGCRSPSAPSRHRWRRSRAGAAPGAADARSGGTGDARLRGE